MMSLVNQGQPNISTLLTVKEGCYTCITAKLHVCKDTYDIFNCCILGI